MTAKQILPLVLEAHRVLVDDVGAQLDISAKALSNMLAASARADPTRFMKLDKPIRYRVAPIGSYLEVKTLPSHKMLCDRRTVKRLKEAKAENKQLRAELDEGKRATAREDALIGVIKGLEKKVAEPLPAAAPERAEVDASSSYNTSASHSQVFKALIRDAMACMPSASIRKFPQMAALIVRAFAHDARNMPLTPELIVRMMPSKKTLSKWQDEQGDVDDFKLARRLQEFAEGFYEIADAGNKKGRKMNFELMAFFDFQVGAVDRQQAANFDVGGGGEESAIAVQKPGDEAQHLRPRRAVDARGDGAAAPAPDRHGYAQLGGVDGAGLRREKDEGGPRSGARGARAPRRARRPRPEADGVLHGPLHPAQGLPPWRDHHPAAGHRLFVRPRGDEARVEVSPNLLRAAVRLTTSSAGKGPGQCRIGVGPRAAAPAVPTRRA